MPNNKLPMIFLSILLVSSSAIVMAQDLAPFPEIENVNASVNIEVTEEGRCKLEITGLALTELSKELIDIPIEKIDMSLKISSPSFSVIRVNVSASIDFTELPSEISGLSKDGINTLIALSGIVGKSLGELLDQSEELGIPFKEYPSEIYELTITRFECTRFSASGRRMEVNFVVEVSGSIPENVREGLPLEMKIKLEVSESLIKIELRASGERGSVNASFKAYPPTGRLEFSLSAVFDLPKEDEKVKWSFTLPSEYATVSEALEDILSSAEISLTLKVPEEASVESLPSGYTTSDGNTFEWSGSAAQNTLLSLLGGQSQASISYTPSQPKPSTVAIGAAVAVIVVALAVVAIVLKKH